MRTIDPALRSLKARMLKDEPFIQLEVRPCLYHQSFADNGAEWRVRATETFESAGYAESSNFS